MRSQIPNSMGVQRYSSHGLVSNQTLATDEVGIPIGNIAATLMIEMMTLTLTLQTLFVTHF